MMMLLTVKQTALLTGREERTVRRWISGDPPVLRHTKIPTAINKFSVQIDSADLAELPGVELHWERLTMAETLPTGTINLLQQQIDDLRQTIDNSRHTRYAGDGTSQRDEDDTTHTGENDVTNAATKNTTFNARTREIIVFGNLRLSLYMESDGIFAISKKSVVLIAEMHGFTRSTAGLWVRDIAPQARIDYESTVKTIYEYMTRPTSQRQFLACTYDECICRQLLAKS